MSSGWDPRPRIETPVPWHDYGSPDCYYETPTPQELARHLRAGCEWVERYPRTAEAKTLLIYAWNEFDEGGWLAPTLSEGSARLDAIREILSSEIQVRSMLNLRQTAPPLEKITQHVKRMGILWVGLALIPSDRKRLYISADHSGPAHFDQFGRCCPARRPARRQRRLASGRQATLS